MSTPLDAVLNELEHADAEFGAGRAGGLPRHVLTRR